MTSKDAEFIMPEFVIRPHGRLHDWIAHEKGYFRDEGLSYRLATDEQHENKAKELDPATGALREIRAGAYEMYERGGGAKGDAHSDISCACHWTVNEAAARNVGRMWASAYAVMPGAIMVRADSPIRRPEDLASREIAVGYRSGSHYATLQALEPFLKSGDIKLKFGGMPWARVDAGVDGDVPAITVWGIAYYACEQLGMRKVVDATFMGGFMVPQQTATEDIERYFRALKRAQLDIDLAAEGYKQHYAREIPSRYRERVDVRLFGPGERVVFLPYSRETFEATQRWIHKHDIFDSAPALDYDAAVATPPS
jgi:NitT/TauT family transport system substrate-binding protein